MSGGFPWSSAQQGDRFRVTRPIRTRCLTHWRAPFTASGRTGSLNPGEILRVVNDSGSPFGAALVPDSEERTRALEAEFVSDEDRRADTYAGFSFVLSSWTLWRSCERLE